MKKKFFTVFLCLIISATCVVVCSCGCQTEKPSTKYEIECELIDNVLTGSESVEFYNFTDNTFGELKFNLFGNAFRKGAKYSPISSQYKYKAYYNGENYGDITINGVTVQDNDAEFCISGNDQNILVVKLSEEIYPEETVCVKIDFSLNIAKCIARTGINDNTVNLGNFYPILCGIKDQSFVECVYYSTGDPFFSDVADYNVKIKADKQFVVASSGELISENQTEDKKISQFTAQDIRSFCLVLSKDYKIEKTEFNGIDIFYYYYNDLEVEKTVRTIVESLEYFNSAFGEYPYKTYSVVQTKLVQGGMEYPSLVMISDEYSDKDYREIIIHETAHQWWQTVVGNNETEEGFLDEGLAEYSVILFYENHSDYGYKREELIKSSLMTFKSFCSVYDKLFKKVDTTMNRALCDFSSEYEYVNIAYIKPCIMYDTLRNTIGDEAFFKGLKEYYKENKFQNATVDNLISAFENQGKDIYGFFCTFIDGKEVL